MNGNVQSIPCEPLATLGSFQRKIFDITQKRYLGMDDLPARAYFAVQDSFGAWAIMVLPAQEIMDEKGKDALKAILVAIASDFPPSFGKLYYYGFFMETWMVAKKAPDYVTRDNIQEYVRGLKRPSQHEDRVERALIMCESKDETLTEMYSIDRADFNKLGKHGVENFEFLSRFIGVLHRQDS